MLRRIVLALLTLGSLTATGASAQDPVLARMATGSLTGAYFPVGVALCRLVNQTRAEHGIRCSAGISQGSVENIELLRNGEVELAIVQSDVQKAALSGEDGIAEFRELRAVMSLHPEPLTIVTRPDTGIAKLQDLEGRTIDIGPPGSGHRALWDRIMDSFGWTLDSFSQTLELDPADQVKALCSKQIDAFAISVGHPALTVQEATLTCGAVLVQISAPVVDKLTAAGDFYFSTEIPGGLYRGNPDPVPTIGVGATLVTTAALPDETIYTIVSNIFSNLDELRALDPVLAGLDPAAMVETGLTAPIHPGAERYYREQGLID